ncbi:amidohydrolase family protein [Marinicella litoralis]|uniref:Imidazolonepropionase-like amidohydrolase n=1 Tax=Marinicella litoralis TaxID=644220 RepID=A0A4R6XI94_9GAMM|nr:amidohydrolase family protein [Marinicella litoralis]TDR17564.1 imidazolonepropionase-like amidohydrolase [Marinicella litoralis]
MTNKDSSYNSSQFKNSKLRKWSFRSLILMTLIAVIAVLWVEYQMRRVKGQLTEVVETADIQPISGEFILKNVHILNPQGDAMLPAQDILVSAGKIKQLGQHLTQSTNLTVVDGQGKFLIPGLMDGHVHLSENVNNLLLYLVNGVTHVRDMGATDYQLKVRDDRSDQALWPDVFVASEKVYTTPWWKTWFMNWTYSRITMSDASQGEAIVNDLKQRGFDALKISNGLEPAHYRSLVKAAHEADLLVTGHIPEGVSIEEVLDLGQQEIAHVEEITKVFEREFALYINEINDQTIAEYLEYVEKRGHEVAKTIKAKGVHVTSVIWLIESLLEQKFELEVFLKTVELEYVDPAMVEGSPLVSGWLPGHHSYASHPYWFESEENRNQLWLYWNTYVDAIHLMTQILVEHEVEFTAGTDSVVSGGVPGFSIHDELQSMVSLGMSTAQALQTATRIPGQWLDKVNKNPANGQVGAIKPGFVANLVLLEKNPLDDIKNTTTINAVIMNGRLYNRSQLDTILARIKSINAANRTQDISDYQ